MNNALLYAGTVLIWGSTWFAITFQLGTVDPALSVAYRFALAAAVLFVYCALTRRRLRFGVEEHLFMLLQGTLLFGVNYLLFYQATGYLTSGLVAVIFSTVIVMNIVNGALFLGTRVQGRVLLGAGIGLVGIVLVFLPELTAFDLSDKGAFGLLLSIAATFSASLGNILSARNQRRAIPIIQTNAYGMTYGALLIFGYALAAGAPLAFDPSPAYIISLGYLALFGSIAAFGCYLTLLGRIGADRAAYATLLFPVVALAISTVFEGYRWTAYGLTGMSLVLIGNFLVLSRPGTLGRLSGRRQPGSAPAACE
jgi:drug/metabolite transporter (DMT)-like permease